MFSDNGILNRVNCLHKFKWVRLSNFINLKS